MKTLLILRHAKSKSAGNLDHDRPLAKRGMRDALRIGKILDERDLNPHLVVSSDAERARQTACLAAKAFCYDAEDIEFTEALYATSTGEHLDLVRSLPDEHDIVMLVGHNPTFEDLVETLTEDLVLLPTATLAHIELDVDSWADVDEFTGELVEVYHPSGETGPL